MMQTFGIREMFRTGWLTHARIDRLNNYSAGTKAYLHEILEIALKRKRRLEPENDDKVSST